MALLMMVLLAASSPEEIQRRIDNMDTRLRIVSLVWSTVSINAEVIDVVKIKPEHERMMMAALQDAFAAADALVAVNNPEVTQKNQETIDRLRHFKVLAEKNGAIRTMALEGKSPATSDKVPSPAWRSTDGFQKVKWGMSSEEVQAAYPTATPERGLASKTELLARSEVAGMPALITFVFQQRRLVKVHLTFAGVDKTKGGALAAYRGLQRTLASKYGRFDESTPLGDDVSEWASPRTYITLKRGAALWLDYESAELQNLQGQLAPSAAEDL